jgi:hypothetical protein
MAKGISGTAIAAAAAGSLLLWSGIKGQSWSRVVRDLISGNPPQTEQENPITVSSGGGTVDGSTSPGATTANLSGNKKIVNMVASTYGWGSGSEWDALVWIIDHESSWSNTAQNPHSTAYGLFQFLNPTWASMGGKKTSDPTTQAQLGLKYIKSRYGDPLKAKAFWQAHNWY